MLKNRPGIPIGLPLSTLVVLILGLAAPSILRAALSDEQLADHALLRGIPFVLIALAILLALTSLILWAFRRLNHRISVRPYRLVEAVFITGSVLGAAGLFQPWLLSAFRAGCIALPISTLGFIFWSQITPAKSETQEEPERLHRTEIQ